MRREGTGRGWGRGKGREGKGRTEVWEEARLYRMREALRGILVADGRSRGWRSAMESRGDIERE
jgi:hypothetical protein